MANKRPEPEEIVSSDWFKDWMLNDDVNISNQYHFMRLSSINGGSLHRGAV